ncbi:hypothetical protein D6O93_01170 [Escherichia coli]|nr:toxin YdaT family protein [Escherichia coli]EIJ03330.1 PF06254 family protein [Escherichia coli B41]EEZ0190878.1 hypothetical protein [Escherichia coli]EFB2931965.1 hypothetical protein [Escherichia coli]EFD0736556.1 hypothetical protein [Escherichia coli]EFH2724095.1 hypothetical protein [Escherichia coli]
MKITPEQAREALDAWICRPGMTQEQATILITEAFWALKERPNIDVQRVTYEGGAIDQRALGVNRVKIFERWKAIDTRDKREKFTALVPAIMEAIRINDFRLYREITDGKSITCMIAGLNKEYGDVVESGLLFAERPLVINTQLAMKIGLNEAIVLQQLHYWLRDTNSGMECDGVRWIYNTTEQWLEQFPFWSESTLKRAFASLKTLGLLRCEKLNKSKRDMTNFYTINYGSELLDGGKLSESIGSKCAAPSGQNDTMEEVKMKRSIGSKRPNVIGSKWPDDLTENTTEITTENKNTFRPEASQPDPQTTEQDFLTRNSDAVVFSAKKRQWGSREDLACAQWIWGRIVGLYEQAASDDGEIMRPKEPNWTAWANDVRTMRMLDGRSHRQICEMFGRVQRDPFWVKNIMSPSKLREKWDELVIRLGRSPVQRCVNHISEPDTEIPPGFRG